MFALPYYLLSALGLAVVTITELPVRAVRKIGSSGAPEGTGDAPLAPCASEE
jgi:hypothetical protein